MNTQIIYVLCNIDMAKELAVAILGILVAAYNFLAFLFVTGLLAFHCYLVNQNVTTAELCNEVWEDIAGNPFYKYILIEYIGAK